MARRRTNSLAYATANDTTVCAGRILGGSGVASIIDGKGFSLTYVSTGRYRVQVDDNYPHFLAGPATLVQATNNYAVKIVAYVVGFVAGGGARSTVDYLVTNAGTATDLGAADELHFVIVNSRSVRP